jgi:hypothetical protein
MAATAWPQTANAPSGPGLTSEQIVSEMMRHDQERTRELQQYTTLRHYQVEYRGFSANVTARMDVEVTYSATAGKTIRIVSQSGSKFLIEKVLKRAVDSEMEASRDKQAMALTPANYRFHLAGAETVAGRPAYILDVDPITPSKFLYRGKVWVDAADFAIAKMETEPSKSPSFWISRTSIHFTGVDVGGFWFPRQVRSETKVRIGGVANLTIDYGDYRVEPQELARASY